MEKTFTFAGVSTLKGTVTARFASDASRVKVLEKNGHTDVRLVELPEAMTKEFALAHLRAHADFQDAEAQEALKGDTAVIPRVKTKVKKVNAPVTLAVAKKAVSEATAIVDADPVKRGRRKLIKETIAKLTEKQREEEEAERARQKEAMQLEVDNYMADVTDDIVPKFLRK